MQAEIDQIETDLIDAMSRMAILQAGLLDCQAAIQIGCSQKSIDAAIQHLRQCRGLLDEVDAAFVNSGNIAARPALDSA